MKCLSLLLLSLVLVGCNDDETNVDKLKAKVNDLNVELGQCQSDLYRVKAQLPPEIVTEVPQQQAEEEEQEPETRTVKYEVYYLPDHKSSCKKMSTESCGMMFSECNRQGYESYFDESYRCMLNVNYYKTEIEVEEEK